MNRLKILILTILLSVLSALPGGIGVRDAQALIVGPNGYYVPDYFTTPNWANSPPLAKFVDTLAPLGCTTPNNLGQCIPIAVPDTTTYPGSDYYEIELVEYREQMHTGLPALNAAGLADKTSPAATGGTKLRGYRQTNPGGVQNPQQPHYLGPLIIASKYDQNFAPGAALPTGGTNGKPVRIKFKNSLPAGTGGNLFLPVDTSVMGSGDYSINYNPVTNAAAPLTSGIFPQNRATLHLHGGRTPWISDGTAHQWITPAGEPQAYGKGVSVESVPDMWYTAAGATITACAGLTSCSTAGATNNPGAGSQTFYWTNQQSSRLMFYHDHAWGITRLNVYAGEAAGYLIQDPVEQALVNGGTVSGRTYTAGTIPAAQIPLIIQDKTFVNATLGNPATYTMATDPTWAWGSAPGKPITATPTTGDLWWPHVYMTAQNPFVISGVNDFGRWHYGPWFFPPTPLCGTTSGGIVAVKPMCIEVGTATNPYYAAGPNQLPNQPPEIPGTPHPSWGAEGFMDTMMVNGTVYPTLAVQPQQYRLRILNASNDKFLNLQFYRATSAILTNLTLTSGGANYTSDPAVSFYDGIDNTPGKGATARATVDKDPLSPTFGQVTAITLDTVGSSYTSPRVFITGGGGTGATATVQLYTAPTEVGMLPASSCNTSAPAGWPVDGREGGVPDPDLRGPAFIQIGSEGGFLPAPVVLPNQPVVWNVDPTLFNVGNVLQQNQGGGTLFLGPAERADVIVDFTNFGGKTLILYNDAPSAFPALDPHYDYYTGAPDRTDIGGYITIPPGVGPNVRTVMQITVAAGGTGTAPVDDYNLATLTALTNAFQSNATTPGVFAAAQDEIVVGQAAYGTGAGNTSAYNTLFPGTWPNWGVSRIGDGAISFNKVDGSTMSNYTMKAKAIHDEMGGSFDDYGRMGPKLGLEQPFINATIANFNLQNFVDPATEIVKPGEIQIWRITHNGVDTHPMHFHLFDVQVLNRVGWDGFIRLPDANELGWKDTVRMSPLEDTIVALRPVVPQVPFAQPDSIRPLNPAAPLGSDMGFSQLNPITGNAPVPAQTNQIVNFGHEYTWHCHILSHEENDMMRPMILNMDSLLYIVISSGEAEGIWQYELGRWTRINTGVPQSIVGSGSLLYADFGTAGIWKWDGTIWTQVNTANPTTMVTSASALYAIYSGQLWQYNGSTWTLINTAAPASMLTSGSTLYVTFTGNGLWKWESGAWTKINTAVPQGMVASGAVLYADMGTAGLWRYAGGAWTKINTANPTSMAASGTLLYATYNNQLWMWNGTTWGTAPINTVAPTTLVTSGTLLYATYGANLWMWNGSTWRNLSAVNPHPTSTLQSMVSIGSKLYADYGTLGLWLWDGSVWTRINTANPTAIVAGL